jgi:hypothetical protein
MLPVVVGDELTLPCKGHVLAYLTYVTFLATVLAEEVTVSLFLGDKSKDTPWGGAMVSFVPAMSAHMFVQLSCSRKSFDFVFTLWMRTLVWSIRRVFASDMNDQTLFGCKARCALFTLERTLVCVLAPFVFLEMLGPCSCISAVGFGATEGLQILCDLLDAYGCVAAGSHNYHTLPPFKVPEKRDTKPNCANCEKSLTFKLQSDSSEMLVQHNLVRGINLVSHLTLAPTGNGFCRQNQMNQK